MEILIIIGTRPEAIKMAPLINLMRKDNRFNVKVCSTSQHTDLLQDALNVFAVKPDFELSVEGKTGNPSEAVAGILRELTPLIAQIEPDFILVQGDTISAFAGALAGYYSGIRVGHVEAGLRTYDRKSPFPEEIHRQMISRIATLHFAPTKSAMENLLSEKIKEETIFLTGNTGVDALMYALDTLSKLNEEALMKKLLPEKVFSDVSVKTKKLIVVTGHRRENIGDRIDNLCRALIKISKRSDAVIVMSVHPNPEVKINVENLLTGKENILLKSPPDYLSFIALLRASYLIISDSGGIQEEAPYLAKPLLITRMNTERTEVVEAGSAKLVGTDEDTIVRETIRLLDDENAYRQMEKIRRPFGEGKASENIIEILALQTTIR